MGSLRGIQYNLPNTLSTITIGDVRGKYRFNVIGLDQEPTINIDSFSPSTMFINTINLPTFDRANRQISFTTGTPYLDTGNVTFAPSLNSFVILAKFRLTQLVNGMTIYDFNTNASTNANAVRLFLNSTFILRFEIKNSTGSANQLVLTSLSSLVIDTDYIVVIRYVASTGNCIMWLNGISQDSTTNPITDRTCTNVRFGLSTSGTAFTALKGQLYQACIFQFNIAGASITSWR